MQYRQQFRWVLMLLVGLSIAGCPSPSGDRQPPATPSPQPSVSPAEVVPSQSDLSVKSTYSMGEEILYGDELGSQARIRVTGMRAIEGKDTVRQPQSGNRWLAVSLEIANRGDRAFIVTFEQMKLADRQGRIYEQSLVAQSTLAQQLQPIPPGQVATGEVAFELPKDANAAKLVYDPLADSCESHDNSLSKFYPCDRFPAIVKLKPK